MSAVLKFFITLPSFNWNRFFDFKKVDEALVLQENSNEERLRLQLR